MGYSIYEITNRENGKKYIGLTTITVQRRWADHRNKLRQGRHHNPHLQSAWLKYGEDAFECEILDESAQSLEELNRLEAHYVETTDNLYNMRAGGEHSTLSEATAAAGSLVTHSQKTLTAIENAIEYRLTGEGGIDEINIAGQSIKHLDMAQLRALRGQYTREVHAEQYGNRSMRNNIQVAFLRPDSGGSGHGRGNRGRN